MLALGHINLCCSHNAAIASAAGLIQKTDLSIVRRIAPVVRHLRPAIPCALSTCRFKPNLQSSECERKLCCANLLCSLARNAEKAWVARASKGTVANEPLNSTDERWIVNAVDTASAHSFAIEAGRQI